MKGSAVVMLVDLNVAVNLKNIYSRTSNFHAAGIIL
jgi:hypothetical protein